MQKGMEFAQSCQELMKIVQIKWFDIDFGDLCTNIYHHKLEKNALQTYPETFVFQFQAKLIFLGQEYTKAAVFVLRAWVKSWSILTARNKQKFIPVIIKFKMIKESLAQSQFQLPISQAQRKSTDFVCTIIGAILALTLFIIACISYNSAGLNKAYFSFDVATTDPSYASSSDYYGFQVAFWSTVISALGLGLLWLAWVHLSPRLAPATAFVFAILSLLTLGVLTLVNNSNFFNNNQGWRIGVTVACFVLAIILFSMFWFYTNALRIQGIFLDYAHHFLHQVKGTFVYILIFLLFLTAFIALITFQHLAFSSKSNSNSNFWDFSNPGLFGVLNILEFIWGFQFLRDAFNFCVSGAAINWYWNIAQPWYFPLKRLLTSHWGSVVAGSFLNGFFEVPTLLVELFTCHRDTCCGNLGIWCEDRCWGQFFHIVRTDSYSYINIAGTPFGNAGRECYKNCIQSKVFVGGYNTMKHYRLAASIFLTTVSYILGHIFTNLRVDGFTWWHNVILIVISYAVITWFVNIDADSAEGISTSFLVEGYKSHGYQNVSLAIPYFKSEIISRTHRDISIQDGHC